MCKWDKLWVLSHIIDLCNRIENGVIGIWGCTLYIYIKSYKNTDVDSVKADMTTSKSKLIGVNNSHS